MILRWIFQIEVSPNEFICKQIPIRISRLVCRAIQINICSYKKKVIKKIPARIKYRSTITMTLFPRSTSLEDILKNTIRSVLEKNNQRIRPASRARIPIPKKMNTLITGGIMKSNIVAVISATTQSATITNTR